MRRVVAQIRRVRRRRRVHDNFAGCVLDRQTLAGSRHQHRVLNGAYINAGFDGACAGRQGQSHERRKRDRKAGSRAAAQHTICGIQAAGWWLLDWLWSDQQKKPAVLLAGHRVLITQPLRHAAFQCGHVHNTRFLEVCCRLAGGLTVLAHHEHLRFPEFLHLGIRTGYS